VSVFRRICHVFSTAHAYVLYATERAATEVYEKTKAAPVHLGERQLIVMRYKDYPKYVAHGKAPVLYYEVK